MHNYPYLSQIELSEYCGIHDSQVFRLRLRRAGIKPCMVFGNCKLYARDRIETIKQACAPRHRGPGGRLRKHDWQAAAAWIVGWCSRSEACAKAAAVLGISPNTLRFSGEYFAKLAEHLERDPKRRKYRVKQATTTPTAQ